VIKTLIKIVIGLVLVHSNAFAAEPITDEQIRLVIKETDAAANKRDVQGIGDYLARDFYKYIEMQSDGFAETARIDREQYLALIAKGWNTIDNYSYERLDLVINIAPDGLSGQSNSTVVETLTVDGKEMVSKVREYAYYMLEEGRPVIFNIESHTLVGDTTPE
jgi:hypothetical protein